jgi:hypothetical protein
MKSVFILPPTVLRHTRFSRLLNVSQRTLRQSTRRCVLSVRRLSRNPENKYNCLHYLA